MPKLKQTFIQGKMNKDLDERLLPNGQYRDALNIQVSNSENSDVGAIENVLGNTKQNKKTSSLNWDANFGLTSPECIGVAKDTLNDKIYWFITATDGDAILEYDQSTGFIAPIILDTRSTSILAFSASYKITGINILEGMLFWTDDNNEPRKLNISDYKTATATSVGSSATSLAGTSKTTEIYSRDFLAADITVIRKSPKKAATVDLDSTLVTSNNQKMGGLNALTIEPFNFNTGGTGLFPKSGDVSITWGEAGVGPLSAFENKKVKLWAYYRDEFGINKKYEIEGTLKTGSFVASGEVVGNYVGADLTIETIPFDVPNAELAWKIQLVEDDYIYKKDFPRFSYRWKYYDGEYSTYAPFSRPAFLAGFYYFDPSTGLNDGMLNHTRKITLTFATDATFGPGDDVEYVEILYKPANSNNVYMIKSHDRKDSNIVTFEITSELTGPVIESLQMLRLWDAVPRKAKSQEIIGNRLIYGNYLNGYTVDPDVTMSTSLSTASHSTNNNGNVSLKSNRTYQLGVSFLDEYNRESPVFTDENSALLIDATNCDTVNKITANVTSAAPSWAQFYKYYIKEITSNYENLVLDRVYDGSDGSVWLSFPSSERNKVKVGDFLSLKKVHGENTAVKSLIEYKVLDIKNEAPFYLVNQPYQEMTGLGVITGTAAFSITSAEQIFYGPPENEKFNEAIRAGNFIQFRNGARLSARYEIKSGGLISGDVTTNISPLGSFSKYSVILKSETGLNIEDEWLTDSTNVVASAGGVEVNIFGFKENYKPEFQGKFFVKTTNSNEISQYIKDSDDDSSYVKLYRTKLSDELPASPNATVVTGVQSTWFGGVTNITEQQPRARMAFVDVNTNPDTGGQHPTNGQDTFDIVYGPASKEGVPNFSEEAGDVYDRLYAGQKIRFAKDGNKSAVYTIISATKGSYSRGGFNYKTAAVTVDRDFDEAFTNGDVNSFAIMLEKQNHDSPVSLSPAVFETVPKKDVDLDIYYEASNARNISNFGTATTLEYYNCITFGNGVESQSALDDFNTDRLGKGVRVSSVLLEPYAEERLGASLIYSGILNTRSGINNSNQFTIAIDITKDLPNTYGGIQKLHARDTDLIALCEDKCFRILANKDALFNADGNTNVTSSNNVLGQTVPYAGEFGISKNPETFASYGFRTYFTDKARGTVLRLSADGLTEIANAGMTDYFEDKFKSHSGAIIGSYDEASGTYNISFSGDESVAFKESINGWPTRLSFTPEFAASLNNEYYTIKDGELWEHSNTTRSNFYGTQEDTTVTLLINDAPSSVKNFKTLAYEGDEGWTATVDTDQQDGAVSSWQKREGFYYNFISGKATTISNMDTSELAVQGLGELNGAATYSSPGYSLVIDGNLNVSLQIGDAVYKDVSGTITSLGTVSAINKTTKTVTTTSSDEGTVADNTFIFFVKDTEKNTSGLLGYYGETKMSTSSGSKKELFAVNAEAFISSE